MLLLFSLLIAVLINITLFFIAYARQSDKLTDFSYALSFIVVVVSAYGLSAERSLQLGIVTLLVVAWALRLGIFLVYRIRKIGKDARFDDIRSDFFKFLKFWVGQAFVAWLLLLPVLFLAGHQSTIGIVFYVGISVWAIGLAIESLADLQKYRFINNPANKGKWIDQGLWHYSRHPNYFGEICIWIGIYIATVGALSPWERALALVSPIAIFITLRFVSGVPLLEKSADKKWGDDPEYIAYRKSTSLLIPWFKKRRGSR